MQAPPAAVNILPSGKFTKLHRISEVEPWRAMRTKLRKEGKVPGSDEGGSPSGLLHVGHRRHRLSRRSAFLAGIPRQPLRRRAREQPRVPGEAEAEWVAAARRAGRRRPRVPRVHRRLVPPGAIRQCAGWLLVRDRHVPRADRRRRVPRPAGARRPWTRRPGSTRAHLADRPRGLQAVAAPKVEQATHRTRRSARTTRTAGTAILRAGCCIRGDHSTTRSAVASKRSPGKARRHRAGVHALLCSRPAARSR